MTEDKSCENCFWDSKKGNKMPVGKDPRTRACRPFELYDLTPQGMAVIKEVKRVIE